MARKVLVVLILIAIALVALVLRPFSEALLLATVLAGALFPTQRWLRHKLGGRSIIAAGLLCLLVLLTVLLVVGGLGTLVVREAIDSARFIAQLVQDEGINGLLDRLPGPIQGTLRRLLDLLPAERDKVLKTMQEQLASQATSVASVAGGVVTGTGALLLHGTLMLIALFFLLTDGRRLVEWLEEVSPLGTGQTTELLREFRTVSARVLSSTLVTACVQTAVAVPGYLIAGVPKPWLFTAATFFLAFIPTIGAGGACALAALVLIVTGEPWMALVIGVWGALLVGLSDNVVKPLLVRRSMHMHGAVVFFSLVSGLAAFGAIGLLIGPLAVSFLLALIRMYRRDCM